MTAIANPFLTLSESNAWGIITLDDKIQFPGIVVSVDGVMRPIEWQEQKGIGITGAALVYSGKKLVGPTKILCEIVNASQWQDWQKHYDYIKVQDGARPKTFKVGHPSFANLPKQVFSSYPEAPSFVGKRKWVAAYELKEYKKPVKAPTGPADPAKVDGPPKPADAAEAALAALVAKVNAAGGP